VVPEAEFGISPLSTRQTLSLSYSTMIPPAPNLILTSGMRAIEEAVQFPAQLAYIFKLFGFTCVILGVIAYFTSHRGSQKRGWGKWLAFTGSIMAIIGLSPGTLLSIIKYMIP